MAITGPASYIPTMNEFLAHWAQCNAALPAATPLAVRLPDNTTVTRAQFLAKRDALAAQQVVVQTKLTDQQLIRGTILLQKTALLERFNQFLTRLDGHYRNTNFHLARPYAPGVTYGQEAFSSPMVDAMTLWAKMNVGPAPAGVTLPLTLPGGMSQGEFASAVSALQFAYADEKTKSQDVILARGDRNRVQDGAYEVMKAYRENVPSALIDFPVLVETMPRLVPLPGHTPDAVNASAVFEAPNTSRVAYEASTDSMLERYELRGTAGDHYDDEDAVMLGTHGPNDPREFLTTFGLIQPGAKVALKVFVILTTGNEAGSAPMLVERPANVQQIAA